MCESIQGCECNELIKTLETQLTTVSENFDYLVSIANNSPKAQGAYQEFGVSFAFLSMNATCGRHDRITEHLKEAWAKVVDKAKQDCAVNSDEFAVQMEYKLVSLMSDEDKEHYAALICLSLNEFKKTIKALLIYQENYYIEQLFDDTYRLIIGNEEWTAEAYCGAAFTEMRDALYDYYKKEVNS